MAIFNSSSDGTTLTDGIGTTVEGNSVNITTPVQGIKTQAEFDALPEEQQNKGLYVISDGESSGGGTSGSGVPSGFIGMWSGEAVPDGWALCNGENGTPDLRDKFILGAGTSHAIGETGGEEEVTLTVEQMPQHSHNYSAVYGNGTTYQYQGGNDQLSLAQRSSLKTATAGSSRPHNNMPPYYVLAFIMKQ